MSTSTSQRSRCPRCDAHVRAGAQWCPLCYDDLRPSEPAPEVAPEAAPEPSPEAAAEPPRQGKHARSTVTTPPPAMTPPTAGTTVSEAEVERMLAQLAATESGVPLGRFAGHLDSPGRRVGLMIGGSIVATGLVFLLMALVGALL